MVPRRLLAATLEIPSCKLTKPTIVGPDPKPRFGETVLVLEGASGPNSWLGSQTIVLTSHRKREGSRQYWSAAFRVPDNGGIGVLSVSKNFFNTNLPDINWGLIPCYLSWQDVLQAWLPAWDYHPLAQECSSSTQSSTLEGVVDPYQSKRWTRKWSGR